MITESEALLLLKNNRSVVLGKLIQEHSKVAKKQNDKGIVYRKKNRNLPYSRIDENGVRVLSNSNIADYLENDSFISFCSHAYLVDEKMCKMGIELYSTYDLYICSVDYIITILQKFYSEIRQLSIPCCRIPFVYFDNYKVTVENQIEYLKKNNRLVWYNELTPLISKYNIFYYEGIYTDLDWTFEMVERYKDDVNWKMLIEKSNLVWSEYVVRKYLSYIPFCVDSNDFDERFPEKHTIQNYSNIEILSNDFLDSQKERINFLCLLKSGRFNWDYNNIEYFYLWAKELGKLCPEKKHTICYRRILSARFFEYLIKNPNFVWNDDSFRAVVDLNPADCYNFLKCNKTKRQTIIDIILRMSDCGCFLHEKLKDKNFLLKLQDGGVLPYDSYSSNFTVENINNNATKWNDVLTDKFSHIHRESSDTYYYVYEVMTMWDYFKINGNLTLTYELCKVLQNLAICSGGIYEKEYDSQDYFDSGYYSKMVNGLDFFATCRINDKTELYKIGSDLGIINILLSKGNVDAMDFLLDLLLTRYSVDQLIMRLDK